MVMNHHITTNLAIQQVLKNNKMAINISKSVKKLSSAKNEIQEILEKAHETYDSRSEKWQESEKGEEFYDKKEELQELFDELESAVEGIENFEG